MSEAKKMETDIQRGFLPAESYHPETWSVTDNVVAFVGEAQC